MLVRNQKTRCFLTEEEGWTPERSLARDFGRTQAAISFIVAGKLEGIEVLLDFGEACYDVCLPVSPPPPPAREVL